MDLIPHYHQHTAAATVSSQGNLYCSKKIGRPIMTGLAGRAHSPCHDHWRIEWPNQVKKICRLFQAIGALGHYNRYSVGFYLSFSPRKNIEQG